ncbi:MAG: AAA family ATPase, partial [Candidatus Babeliales bacterium]
KIKEIRSNIQQMGAILTQIRGDTFVAVNEASLKMLLTINNAAIDHIRNALSNGFKEFPAFDWQQTLITQAPTKAITLEGLQGDAKEIDKKLVKLTKEAQNVGLTWYNKAYRALDDTIIHPAQKYKVGRYAFLATVTGTCAFLIWWATNNDGTGMRILERPLKYLRNWIGYAPNYIRPGEIDTEYHNGNAAKNIAPHPMRSLGQGADYLVQFTKGYMPMHAFAFTLAAAAWTPELTAAKDYLGKKGDKLVNFLKGGGYKNKIKPDEDEIIPKVTLKDLVGLDHVKQEFTRIIEFLKDPERYVRSKLKPELGFLLTGPTRTGKTFSAEALAGEIRAMLKAQGKDEKEFSFIPLHASFIEEKGIRWILHKAREVAPCILFIDEIDLLGLQRAGGRPERLSDFLSTMSGCLENNDPSKPVIIIAATNKPENLDVALRQRGRFGKEIRFEYPPTKDRRDYFTNKLSTLALSIDAFNIEQLVRDTEGCSYEQLNALIQSAFQVAKINGELLTQAHLDDAFDREIRHIIMAPLREINAQEKRLIAIHQAGRALAVMLLNGNQKLSKVTIRPYLTEIREETVWDQYYLSEDQKQKKISYGRIFTHHDQDTINFDSLDEKINTCKILLAGHAAENIVLGSCGYSYHPEASQRAFDIAKSIALQGIDLSTLPDDLRKQYVEKALALRTTYEQEIMALLSAHQAELKLIADALQQHETLSYEDIDALLHPEKYKQDEKPAVSDNADIKAAVQQELGIEEVPAPVAAPAA